MPIAARIDILKLRYYWQISHKNDYNLAFSILESKRKNLHHTKIGFLHEVQQLCRKHNCFDVWLKICGSKENPLNTIRRTVELIYLKLDYEKCLASTCMYSTFLNSRSIFLQKKYMFDEFFTAIRLFPDTNSRRLFIYAILDRCNVEKACPKCGECFKDVLQHTLRECPQTGHLRLRLQNKLKFYNAPPSTEFSNKAQLFILGLSSKLFRIVFCGFLLEIYD